MSNPKKRNSRKITQNSKALRIYKSRVKFREEAGSIRCGLPPQRTSLTVKNNQNPHAERSILPKKQPKSNKKKKSKLNLNMKCASAKFAPTFIVELHPSLGLAKARPLPLDSVVGACGAHESRQKVDCTVDGVENRPCELPGQHRKNVPRPNWGFQGRRRRQQHQHQKRYDQEGFEMGLDGPGRRTRRRRCHGRDGGGGETPGVTMKGVDPCFDSI